MRNILVVVALCCLLFALAEGGKKEWKKKGKKHHMRKNVGQMENGLEKKGKGRYGVSGHMHKGKKPWKKGKVS